MSTFPWEEFRKAIVSIAGCEDDYVTISGAGEAIVQSNYLGAALTWKVRISPRRVQGVGQGRADKTTTIETIGGKDYRVVTQSGHDGHRIDIVVESFDTDTYAGDVLRGIARAFEDESTHARLSELNLSVAVVGDGSDIAFVRDKKDLSAASLELLVYHKWERIDQTARELIESIEVHRA